jgi:hypothetical protein
VAILKELNDLCFLPDVSVLIVKTSFASPPPTPTKHFYRNMSVLHMKPSSIFDSLKKKLEKLRFWVNEDVAASMVPWIQHQSTDFFAERIYRPLHKCGA